MNEVKERLDIDLSKTNTLEKLNELKTLYMGKKGIITELTLKIKDLPNEEKREYGKNLNELKDYFNEKYEKLKEFFEMEEVRNRLKCEKVDVTLPGVNVSVGAPHILEKVVEELEELYLSMGYDVVEGPEVEQDLYNFEMLNLPKGHPARDAQDTFYIKGEEILLRSQTSPVQIRTLLTCRSKHGVCAKCYGRNMAGKDLVSVGEAVGIIAAQSIGEPGTQLTMRTFHTGGAMVAADITKGLPRVEEIFEARRPKGEAVLSEVSGKVSVKQEAKCFIITVKTDDGEVEYEVKKPAFLKVKTGDTVEIGTQLTDGSINPSDLLRTRGLKGLQDYLLKEVIAVYRAQDVKINDKHIEIIISQMLRKVKIENAGDTKLLPGEVVDVFTYEAENEKVLAEGGVPAIAKRILLGITKASLSTESFLSAASFQETSRVLTDAALKGKVDHLMGLKENVIIGKLIPAGTGMKQYRTLMPVEREKPTAI